MREDGQMVRNDGIVTLLVLFFWMMIVFQDEQDENLEKEMMWKMKTSRLKRQEL